MVIAVFTHVPNLTISMNNSGINGHAAVLQNVVSKLIGVMHYLCWPHIKSSKFEFEPQIKEHKKEWTYKGYWKLFYWFLEVSISTFAHSFFGILIECLIFAHNKRDLGRGRILFFLSLIIKQMMVNLLCEGILW